jgi:AbrB family looped-hinge helix DNA binding protein
MEVGEMTLTKMRPKGQLTLPDSVRKAARLNEGDYLEVSVEAGAIVMRPKKLIDAAQAWFWTAEWQRGEREATEEIAAGRTRRAESADEFLDSLG